MCSDTEEFWCLRTGKVSVVLQYTHKGSSEITETVAFQMFLNKQIKNNTPKQPNKKPGCLKSGWKGCVREKSGQLWSRLMRKKCKQDCPNISASAAEAVAGNAQNKHIATTIGNLCDLLLAPADVSENQINLWLLWVMTFQLLSATTQETALKRCFLTDLK